MFKKGDTVICIRKEKLSRDSENFSEDLIIEKEYIVEEDEKIYNNKCPSETSIHLKGENYAHLSTNFKLKTTMSEQNLTITKEKVLEAASKCSAAKATLEVLFPEVFNQSKKFDLSKLKFEEVNGYMFTDESAKAAGFHSKLFFQINKGEDRSRKDQCFYLFKEVYGNNPIKWTLEERDDCYLLVPSYTNS